ncbi:GNAT family N-acetyltransferase [Polynucleobacter sp. HIN7]|uniref:GNAT family N-acetyltransferase n=1 Tax=Polynucleobacter sp. HIN7 TaxID=3047866 RepID=UPI002572EF2C|nr:GNAT family N-acetyltransferase [Polynucleobacter sp. HIN7]
MPEFVGKGLKAKLAYREIARIHLQCINKGFLPKLGERFLTLLYKSIDEDPNSIIFVERKEGQVVAFVAGGRGMRSIYRQMLWYWPNLLAVLLPALFNPFKLKRIIEIIMFSQRQKLVLNSPKAELFSIAVLDSERGRGLAAGLYDALKQHFTEKGESAFCIVVGNRLISAHHFYQRMGATPIARLQVHKGELSILYRQNLSGSVSRS